MLIGVSLYVLLGCLEWTLAVRRVHRRGESDEMMGSAKAIANASSPGHWSSPLGELPLMAPTLRVAIGVPSLLSFQAPLNPCARDSRGHRSGCNTGCQCEWYESCFPAASRSGVEATPLAQGAGRKGAALSDNVGRCGTAHGVVALGTVAVFFSIWLITIAARAVLLTCADRQLRAQKAAAVGQHLHNQDGVIAAVGM